MQPHDTTNKTPYGYCHCGCGQLAPIAKTTNRKWGHVKGQPVRYIAGHFGRKPKPNSPDLAPWVEKYGLQHPYGECQCGCGRKTSIAKSKISREDVDKGHPHRFFAKHNAGGPPRNVTFWKRVKCLDADQCWEWQGGKTDDGYGAAGIRGKSALAHRVAWELTNGPIPEGMEVCHHCDNPPCVNPAHLFLGSHADNIRDMFAKGRGNPGGNTKKRS